MIFQHTLNKVLDGRKTQTRRRIGPNDSADRDDNGVITAVRVNGRLKWAVGRTYAIVPARGKPSVARMRITALGQAPVQAITEADAQAEGYTGREAFLASWTRIHGEAAQDAAAWIVYFELA